MAKKCPFFSYVLLNERQNSLSLYSKWPNILLTLASTILLMANGFTHTGQNECDRLANNVFLKEIAKFFR